MTAVALLQLCHLFGVSVQTLTLRLEGLDLLARRLDDGEAMTIALASTRGWVVLTEDRKAERLLEAMNIPTLSSIAMIRQWADRQDFDRQSMRSIVLDVRVRARWRPGVAILIAPGGTASSPNETRLPHRIDAPAG